ncbi:hypothetical protein [Agromyces badenianii]|uniref:hypothetical protein n=1 Tax=Agromyces badenianii TaxID=2080742 RepID=UPI000D59A19F|nr:hypothetical protein [Agromyces badenianii]PWC04258.1 hypothetical protein DCE94_08880 [Agromyces badenianii]
MGTHVVPLDGPGGIMTNPLTPSQFLAELTVGQVAVIAELSDVPPSIVLRHLMGEPDVILPTSPRALSITRSNGRLVQRAADWVEVASDYRTATILSVSDIENRPLEIVAEQIEVGGRVEGYVRFEMVALTPAAALSLALDLLEAARLADAAEGSE